jgi:ABC-type phosphate transport system substrate-binding protein
LVALALGAGIGGSLALAPASLAVTPAYPPATGINCQSQDGKVDGRGSTLQVWLQYAFIGAYSNDVCGGSVAADASADAIGNAGLGVDNDVTDPGSAFYNLPNGTQFGRNWMLSYDDPQAQALGAAGANAATGSGSGETAIGCDAVGFSGTDIPVTSQQLSQMEAPPVVGSGSGSGPSFWESVGKNCDPVGTAGGLDTPFSPLPLGQDASGTDGATTADSFPNPGDTFTGQQVMLFPIGISAVTMFANLPKACGTGTLKLSGADLAGIWGGSITDWSQITDAGFTAGSVCTTGLPIVRVVRSDNSGTTQSFDNYLADANGYSATTCDAATGDHSQTFAQLQNNQAQSQNSDAYWPGTGGKISIPSGATAPNVYSSGTSSVGGYAHTNALICGSPILASQNAGGPALIDLAETVSGAIGYADYADTQHDTSNFASSVTNNKMDVFNVQSSSGSYPADAVAPITSTKASNCSAAGASLPGGATDAVNLNQPGDWDLTAETAPNQSDDDIAYADEGSTYPICSLTWDFVWAGEAGNEVAAPVNGNTAVDGVPAPTSSGVTLPSTQVPISSTAGVPDQGSFDVVTGSTTTTTNDTSAQTSGFPNATLPVSSLELASTAGMPYSGTVTLTSSAGSQTLSYTSIDGNILQGVSGGTGTVALNGATVTIPQAQTFTYTGIGIGTGADAGTVTAGGGTTGTGCTLVAAPCLTGVSGGSGSIASGATLVFPQGTGGPEANLTADQRRTLYSYYTYLMSPEAQSKTGPSFYAPLPSGWLQTILQGFQGNF